MSTTQQPHPIHVASITEAQVALTTARQTLAKASMTMLRQAMSHETRVIATAIAGYGAEIEKAERRLVQVASWVSDTPLAALARAATGEQEPKAPAPDSVPVGDMIRQDAGKAELPLAPVAHKGTGRKKS